MNNTKAKENVTDKLHLAAVRSFADRANISSLAMSYHKSIERLVLADTRTLDNGLAYMRNLGDVFSSFNSSVQSSEVLDRIRDAINKMDRLTAASSVQLSSERSSKLYSREEIHRKREKEGEN